MGLDAAKSWYLNNRFNVNSGKAKDFVKLLPLAARSYGENAQNARQNGADSKGAALYGAATAITDAKIEKWFDGLSGIYGDSIAKKLAKLLKVEINSGNLMSKLLRAAANDSGEGFIESALTDIANQMLKSVYNEKSVEKNLLETEWFTVRKNMLINTIVGILLGDAAWQNS